VESFIRKITSGWVSFSDTTEFLNEIEEAQFLFDDDVNKFTTKIHSIGVELALLNDEIKMLTGQNFSDDEKKERKEYMMQKSNLIKEAFVKLPAELNLLFDPLLRSQKSKNKQR
jgi:hypothetical protein